MIKILIFTIANMLNVVFSTIKSIYTVKGNRFQAALSNAVSYGYYTIIIVLVATYNIDLWLKVVITFFCNFVGVYVVKYVENKKNKENLWIFNSTVSCNFDTAKEIAKEFRAKVNCVVVYDEVIKNKLYNFHIHSENNIQSILIRKILIERNMSYYVVTTLKE